MADSGKDIYDGAAEGSPVHSTRPGIPSGHGGRLCGPVVDTRRFFFRNCPTVSSPIQSLWNSKRMRGGLCPAAGQIQGDSLFTNCPTVSFATQTLRISKRMRGGPCPAAGQIQGEWVFENCPTVSFAIQTLRISKRVRGGSLSGCGASTR